MLAARGKYRFADDGGCRDQFLCCSARTGDVERRGSSWSRTLTLREAYSRTRSGYGAHAMVTKLKTNRV